MEKLKVSKRVLKSSLTRLASKIDSTESSTDLQYYTPKLVELDIKSSELFQSIFDICEEVDLDGFISEQGEVRDTIDRLNLLVLKETESASKISQAASNISKDTQRDKINVRLPEIPVPHFSGGNPVEWLSFRDLFSACVIQNEALSPAQKLQYLKGALRGDALRVINTLSLTNANFDIAWSLLEERYANKRELVFTIIKQFMNSPSVIIESEGQLLNLIDLTRECIRSLESLDIEVDGFAETLFVYTVQQKLDPATRGWWERSLKDDSLPKLDQLLSFLKFHAGTLQSSRVQNKRSIQSKVSAFSSECKNSLCAFCNASEHSINKCVNFLKLGVQKRVEFVKANKLCFNCMQKHRVENCGSNYTCRVCFKKHHTVLCFKRHSEKPLNVGSSISVNAPAFVPQGVSSNRASIINDPAGHLGMTDITSCVSDFNVPDQVLLCTALVNVRDSNDDYQVCRVLLDPGSQASFISESCMVRLGLPRKRAKIQISCLGTSSSCSNGMSEIEFTPHFSSGPVFNTPVYVLSKIIGELPHFNLDKRYGELFSDLVLADPTFFKTGPVDILLGVNISLPMLQGQTINRGDGKPFAVRSQLGWIVSGSIPSSSGTSPTIHVNNIQVDLDTLVSNFWKLDSVPVVSKLTDAEQSCEDFFVATHCRDQSGKYVVRLPFHTSPTQLGDSKQMALRRFYRLERSLSSNPDIYEQYRHFMKEYTDLGHMEEVMDVENTDVNFYLPHHCVLKPSSTTSKLRVVFDASAKTSSGLSLNDLLMTGPRVQSELFPILLRFRMFPVALCADVEKMFRQIKVHSADTNLQRIIWRDCPQRPLSIFKLTTVTYGMACSPYLSTRALRQLALDECDTFPLASASTLRDFYVDDLLAGSNSVKDARELVNQMLQMMERGGFRLRKWISNCSSIFDGTPGIDQQPISQVKIENDSCVRVFGSRVVSNY